MRLATVAGKVTLCMSHPRLPAGRLLLVCPWNPQTFAGEPQFDPSIVVFDELGANIGQRIGVSEGREAAQPFDPPAPVDAYSAALIDELFYRETAEGPVSPASGAGLTPPAGPAA